MVGEAVSTRKTTRQIAPPDSKQKVQLNIAGTLAFIVWLLGSIGTFFLPAPFFEMESQSATIMQARFTAATLITVAYALTFVLKSDRHLRGWTVATALTLAGTLISGWLFYYWRPSYTTHYPLSPKDPPRVIGKTLKQRNHEGLDPVTLLEKYKGDAEMVWHRDEIISRRLQLAQSYSLMFALTAVLLIASAQYRRIGEVAANDK